MAIDDKERARRRRLLKAHLDAENSHDINAVMATFAPNAINTLNEIVATDSQTTQFVHELLGFGGNGLLANLVVIPHAEHFTDDEIVHEGLVCGFHSGFMLGFPEPTYRDVKLPYVNTYRFDEHDLLASERVKLDMSQLYVPIEHETEEGE